MELQEFLGTDYEDALARGGKWAREAVAEEVVNPYEEEERALVVTQVTLLTMQVL